jgi:hypothetical protein
MNILIIKDFVGENAITLSDGQKIYDQIYPLLKSGNKVEIDFNGVKVFAAPFFNGAIGQLLKEFKPVVLNELLDLKHLSDFGKELAKRIILNANQYYSNPAIKQSVDKAIALQADSAW